jgi:lipopolysaccharide transport system ATP-binding protein
MTRPAIKVEGLSKEYMLGGEATQQKTFREMLAGAAKEPLRRLKRLQGSSKQQQRFWALRDINFSVNEGEVVGIIGANGAGKSTLLKILSRITAPSEGRIQYRGRIASLLEVGTGFHPELTGRENIFINGAILGMTRNDILKRFDEIVDFAGIEKFLNTPVKRYSSGMYVRLAFAVAAHMDPDILVIDEVLAVGDTAFQKKCLGKMRDVAGQGRTILFVSHNLAAVQVLCTQGLMLWHGRSVFLGSAEDAIHQYLSTMQDDPKYQNKEKLGSLVTTVTLVNADNSEIQNVQMGAGIEIKLSLSTEQILQNVIISIGIKSEFTEVVAIVGTFDIADLSIPAGDSVLAGKIERLMLTPGIYYLTIDVRTTYGQQLERLEDVVMLRISGAYLWNSGWMPPERRKSWIIDSDWHLV